MKQLVALALGWSPFFLVSGVQGFVLSFQASDFGRNPVFSSVTTFGFEARIDEVFRSGDFSDPVIGLIGYNVSGALDSSTPSGFPSFAFQLSDLGSLPSTPSGLISGSSFYSLNADAPVGTRLDFSILPSADLSDGLQVSELAGTGDDVVFRFNGREVGTGRYHPALIELRADGTGTIQNSNNFGGDNPQDNSPDEIDVDFGEEYITDLTFDPAALTIAVPEPSTALLVGLGLLAFGRRRR